ncbi:MAG: DUF3823 domain-containing protein [Fermentimonas sp.]|nr:DUF3823 domain-containing protein [Fermentimonas sp.]
MIQNKYFIILFLSLIVFTACGLDNYDAPQSELHGKVTYNGQTLGLRGTGEAIQLQLYQDGYELRDNIPVYVGQDGTFKALLFDGEYKLVTRNQNGPWVNSRDTTIINVKGSTTIDVGVTPYFTISNANISLSGSVLSSTFTVNKVVQTENIDYVMLLVSKTHFVDDVAYIGRQDFRGLEAGALNLSMDLSENQEFATAKALYARVGVRTAGADQAIYSEVIKIK